MKNLSYLFLLAMFGIFDSYADDNLYQDLHVKLNEVSETKKNVENDFVDEIYDEVHLPKHQEVRSASAGYQQQQHRIPLHPDILSHISKYYPQDDYPASTPYQAPSDANANLNNTSVEAVSGPTVVQVTTTLSPVVVNATTPKVDIGITLEKYCLSKRGVFPSPFSCRRFINCWDGQAYEMKCPSGLLFSTSGFCDHRQNVDCKNRPIDDDHNTVGCKTAYSVYRNPANCSEFFVCVMFTPVKLACPKTLVFDNELKVCNYRTSVNCPNSRPLIEQTLLPEDYNSEISVVTAIQQDIPMRITNTDVPCKTNAVFRMGTGCSSVSLCGINGYLQVINCPSASAYDVQSGNCLPENLARC